MQTGLKQLRHSLASPHLITIILAFFLIHCSGPENTRQRNLEQNADFLKKQAQLQWDQRDHEKHARQALFFWGKVLTIRPNDSEVNILYSRACFFVARYWEKEKAVQDSLYQSGSDQLERMLFPDTLRQEVLLTSQDSFEIQTKFIDQIPAGQMIPLYWWAKNKIHNLIDQSVLERMNEREVLESALHRILNSNPTYDNGGIYRLFGTFYARLPGVELERAESYFKQARDAYPNCFATVVQQAQYLDTKAGYRDRFHEELTWVVEQNPMVNPDLMPENTLDQKLAKQLLDEESFLFE